MAGFKGRDVHFSEPYRPFTFPAKYSQTVDYPIVGLAAIDTTLAVLTSGVPFFIQGTHPESMSMVKSDIHQACVSKQSIVTIGGVVFYASPDGICMLSPGGSGLATESLFSQKQWQSITPSSIRAYQWESKYIGFYDTGGASKGGFVFDPAAKTFIWHDVYARAGYTDLLRDRLFLVIGNEIHAWFSSEETLGYQWKSKRFTLPLPLAMSCGRVEAENYPIFFKLFADGVVVHSQAVTSRNIFRLPAGIRARDYEIEVSGDREIFSAGVAQSPLDFANA